MKIIPICPNAFASNCYLLVSQNEAIVVDPSVSVDAILRAAQEEGVTLVGILLTHGHFDHVLSLDVLRESAKIPAAIHGHDAVMLTDGKKNAFYDFFGKERTYGAAEKLLSDGDRIPLGEESITVIHTPGHTGGSVCYLGDDFLVTGDTLFSNTFGRYDLWSGNAKELKNSLAHLRTIDPSLVIYPGHGESARLGDALDEVAYFI
ncbi:MAG: MBL fold metallo-hydrolase [Clostridia bacterium]|nr:MBL fold metallo-hydrolase [Clostridia bacterium]